MENNEHKQCKDYAKCMEILQLILDGEANEGEKEYYKNHMEKCMPCYKAYNLESAIRHMLKSNLEKKEVPTDLIDCIKSKIRETV